MNVSQMLERLRQHGLTETRIAEESGVFNPFLLLMCSKALC